MSAIVIVGPPGIGKTSLGEKLAEALRSAGAAASRLSPDDFIQLYERARRRGLPPRLCRGAQWQGFNQKLRKLLQARVHVVVDFPYCSEKERAPLADFGVPITFVAPDCELDMLAALAARGARDRPNRGGEDVSLKYSLQYSRPPDAVLYPVLAAPCALAVAPGAIEKAVESGLDGSDLSLLLAAADAVGRVPVERAVEALLVSPQIQKICAV